MKVNFEVGAKAARLIGRENIPDVDGALTELIKNAYDADASCVYVDFDMRFLDIPSKISAEAFLDVLSQKDYKKVIECYDHENGMLYRQKNLSEEKKKELQTILFSYNKIVVADNGTGMSLDIVLSSWMQIATSDKEKHVKSNKGRVKTGAKGIGRFALDKLSQNSLMFTQSAGSPSVRWTIDWEQFSSAKILREVNADVTQGDFCLVDVLRKYADRTKLDELLAHNWETGTLFVLSPTREAWSTRLFEKVNTNMKSINPLGSVDQFDVIINNRFYSQYSYQTEVVAIDKRDYDYKITVVYDGENELAIEILRNEFDGSKRYATFSLGDNEQRFALSDFWGRSAFADTPYRKIDYCTGTHKIMLPVDSFIETENYDLVQAVGPFSAELYFVKNGKSDFPFIKDVPTRHRKELLNRFSGVKLYRDNFKVRPYGDEGSHYDWLELNERANKSPAGVSHKSGAWRVLPYQMIGAVKISRIDNVALFDMANREGLTPNEAYFHFVHMLQEAIARFEFDRQYIYREYDKWKKECEAKIASASERIKEDVRSKSNQHNNIRSNYNTDLRNSEKENEATKENRFTEQEYRQTVDELMREAERELKTKQTLEALSSAGVILNTFFHEFSGISTALHTRGSQMRARLDYALQGKAFEGPTFLDPYRKLEAFDKVDNLLDGWLKIVLDAVGKESFQTERLSVVDEANRIIASWTQLLEEKQINIDFTVKNISEDGGYLKIAVVDFYIIINNFILNSVWFLEKSEQHSREVHFYLEEDNNALVFRMMNNGPALDIKYHDQPMLIFEIGESTKPHGTGLGLWLMRDAVERNDGEIKIVEYVDGFCLEIWWEK